MNIEICMNWLYPWQGKLLRRALYLSHVSNNDLVGVFLKLTMRSLIDSTLDLGKKWLRNLPLTSFHVVSEWYGCELSQSTALPPKEKGKSRSLICSSLIPDSLIDTHNYRNLMRWAWVLGACSHELVLVGVVVDLWREIDLVVPDVWWSNGLAHVGYLTGC